MQPATEGTRARRGNAGAIANVLALSLAVLALALAIALPRMPGPQGPPGLDGAGVVVSSSSVILDLELATCTNVNEVTIEVRSPGTVVVTSMVRLYIDHSQGTHDLWHARHSTSPADCGTGPAVLNHVGAVDTTLASDNAYPQSGVVSTAYEVVPATYTYYLNVQMLLGMGNLDRIVGANTVATFYPGG